jgi:hypothetical protein
MRVTQTVLRTSLGTATVVLLFSGLGGTAQADAVFGIDGQTDSCGWLAEYNLQPLNVHPNGLAPNAPGQCNVTGSASTAPGLTSASGNISAVSTRDNTTTSSGSWGASLSSATLHASSATFVYANLTNNSSDTQLWDQLTFSISGATSTTVTNIPVFFSVDGSGTDLTSEAYSATLQFNPQGTVSACCHVDEVVWGWNPNNGPTEFEADSGTVIHSSTLGALGSIDWQTPSVNTLNNLEIEGILSLTGPTQVVDIFADLSTFSNQGTVDFSNTAEISFQLPAGVSYTSASGVFGSTAVPEPSTFGLCAVVLAGLGIFRRRLLGK